MFVARDENGYGGLWLFLKFPEKGHHQWKTEYQEDRIQIDSSLFPSLTWEDEPVEIVLVPYLQYKNEKLAHEYMKGVFQSEHKDSLWTFSE